LVYTKQYTGRYLNIETAEKYYNSLQMGDKLDELLQQ